MFAGLTAMFQRRIYGQVMQHIHSRPVMKHNVDLVEHKRLGIIRRLFAHGNSVDCAENSSSHPSKDNKVDTCTPRE